MKRIIDFVNITGWGIMSLFWLYIASRMTTRGVLRSIDEWKDRRNGEEEEKGQ